MNPLNLSLQIQESRNYFGGTTYDSIVSQAENLFEQNRLRDAEKALSQLPSNRQLVAELVERLKGKSVYRTLERISLDKLTDDTTTLKALSSLLTHVVIECEQGRKYYRRLIPVLIEKINGVGFGLISKE